MVAAIIGDAVPAFDVQAAGLLPADWQDEIAALASGSGRQRLIEMTKGGDSWTFDVVPADVVIQQLGWLSLLYNGALRSFASTAFKCALLPARRRSATVTLNLLAGIGATNEWHSDSNSVTGVLYVTSLTPDDGGQLEFRDGPALCPRAGQFVCFAGGREHRTAPLRRDVQRLALAMTYYAEAADQSAANAGDIYTLPSG